MKKRVLIFLTIFTVLVCSLAIAVSAADTYSDYTKPSADGKAPIFTFLGFAVDESAGNLCVDYKVDVEALKDYENSVGGNLEFGVVAAYKGYVEGGVPLDPATGLPRGANKDKIAVRKLSSKETTGIISVKLTGMTPELFSKEIFLSLYTFDKTGVKYVTDFQSTDAPEWVSYEFIKGPLEITINKITYSTDGVTAPAGDRIKQMNASNADYKKGSSESTSLYRIMANLIVTGGNSLGMPNAAKFMNHYLGNTGKQYTIDVASMMSSDSGALSCRNTAINNALRAAEALAREGKTFTINQLSEGHPMQWQLATNDWQYSLGSYFDDVDVINLTVTEIDGVKVYSADIKYIVTDFYNWDTTDYNKFKDIISPHQLHELHKAGKAREFLSYGEITYKNITWTEGQTASEIAGLK